MKSTIAFGIRHVLRIMPLLVLGVSVCSVRDAAGRGQERSVGRSAVGLIPLNVTVTDAKGRAVSGIRKEDFKIYEDGIEQSIAFFGAETLPISWGLVLDRSGSMKGMFSDARDAGLQVFEEASPRDDIFFMPFDSSAQILSDFDSDNFLFKKSLSSL